jgi:hypothetical protein
MISGHDLWTMLVITIYADVIVAHYKNFQMGIVETKEISADASLMQCQNKKANGNNWRDGRTLGRLMEK